MDGEQAFALATRGVLADTAVFARALTALSEEITASQLRSVQRTVDLSTRMVSGEGSWPGLLQALQSAATDAMGDARRIGELALVATCASAHPFTQFLPESSPDLPATH
jgi:hypothetical protein